MNTLVISDTHIGCNRQGGSTPITQLELKDYLRSNLAKILKTHGTEHVIVNGDMFDSFAVDTSEVVKVYELFADWLHETNGWLTCIAGNHDWNPRGLKMSSFHLLTHFLKIHFGERVKVVDKGFTQVTHNIYSIPHMPNQSLFDLEIEKACKEDGHGRYLLLHCNVKNTFAEHSDSSLNLNNELLGNLMKAGYTLVVAHEHQQYELRGGRVIVVGNQFPSSISDCIGEKSKRAIRITDTGHEFVTTWTATNSYAEIHWADLHEVTDDAFQFIRVVGEASAEQSAEVVNVIAKFRQRSKAFVVANAVRVDGHSISEDAKIQTVEAIKSFDVIGEIMKHLDEREQAVVKGLLGE